jgi:ParB-like chromosome segregation protein Spo0J
MPKTEQVLVLNPNEISVGWRARGEMRDLRELADSIEATGQLQPIVVSKNGDGKYELIAGERRLQACKLLEQGVKAIVVKTDDAADALWKQLVENVQRNDFTKLELGEGLRKHKILYEELHPETKHGQTQNLKRGDKMPEVSESDTSERAERYTKHVASEMGIGETRVKEAIKLATDLPEAKKDEIKAIADPKKRSRAEHKALADMRKENRAKKLRERAKQRQAERDAAGQTESRIDLGNCREILKAYAATGLVFDAVLTDPPYGLDWSHIEHTCRASLNDAPSWDDLDVGWVFDVAPLLADDSVVLVFTPAEAIGVYQEVFYEVGLKYRGPLCWWKTNPAPVHRPGNYISAIEMLVWATKGQPYFKDWENAGVEEAHNAFRSPICQGDERLAHETQKPEAVIERLIERHIQEGDFVLDPFMGTGTTLVCCKRRGIPCAGIEQDPRIFELAKARILAL